MGDRRSQPAAVPTVSSTTPTTVVTPAARRRRLVSPWPAWPRDQAAPVMQAADLQTTGAPAVASPRHERRPAAGAAQSTSTKARPLRGHAGRFDEVQKRRITCSWRQRLFTHHSRQAIAISSRGGVAPPQPIRLVTGPTRSYRRRWHRPARWRWTSLISATASRGLRQRATERCSPCSARIGQQHPRRQHHRQGFRRSTRVWSARGARTPRRRPPAVRAADSAPGYPQQAFSRP